MSAMPAEARRPAHFEWVPIGEHRYRAWTGEFVWELRWCPQIAGPHAGRWVLSDGDAWIYYVPTDAGPENPTWAMTDARRRIREMLEEALKQLERTPPAREGKV